MWNFKVYDFLSGDLVGPLVLSQNQMGRALNAGRSGTSVWVPPVELRGAALQNMCTPWSRVLVKFWGKTPKFAHLFMNRTWDEDKDTYELGHSDFWSLLGKRTTFGTDGYGNDEFSRLTMENMSLKAMVPWTIWAGTEGPTANFAVPLWLPEGKLTYALINSLPHSGPDKRNYWDYEVQFVDEVLNELMESEGGPDVDFVPQIVDGKFRLLLRYGVVDGGTSSWHMDAPVRGLTKVKFREDATTMANVNYAVGAGSERLMKVRTARTSPAGMPALERAENYKQIEELGPLQGHANADLALRLQPTKQMSASMVANFGPTVAAIDPGHTMRVKFKNHRIQPDGWQNHRVISFDTNLTHDVTLELQPTGGV